MQRPYMKFVIAGVLLTLGVVVLGVATLRNPNASLLHFTPDKLAVADPTTVATRGIQVDGYVAEGTEEFNATIPELRFQIRDADKTAFFNVIYRQGLKPDSFRAGQGVVVDGTYDPATKTIHATKLMTKCPSKYEADPAGTEAEVRAMKSYAETRDSTTAGGIR